MKRYIPQQAGLTAYEIACELEEAMELGGVIDCDPPAAFCQMYVNGDYDVLTASSAARQQFIDSALAVYFWRL